MPKSRDSLPPPPRYRPQLALLVASAPSGDDWLHEDKLDGYRIGCRIDHGKIELISRRNKDWTDSFPGVRAAAERMKVASALLDGEVAVLDREGRTSFQALQNAFSEGGAKNAVYFVFDVLFLDGEDLTRAPLEERKKRLRALLGARRAGPIRFVPHTIGGGPAAFEIACARGLEGIISKRRQGKYLGGRRDPSWQKTKCIKRQEFVIGGFTDPERSREGIGALLVGYYDDEGRLHFAGKVGTGYTRALLLELRRLLDRIEQVDSPFAAKPPGWPRWNVHWVAPRLVGEVAFTEWTHEGIMRHPSFQGLRLDKKPADVKLEVPLPSPER